MDLLKYYYDNIQETDYYYKFYNELNIEDIFGNLTDCNFFDTKEVIQKFKELCMPQSNYSSDDNSCFILICYFLNKNGYFIKQFPNVIERPKSLDSFAYDDIRSYIHTRDKYYDTVTWAQRRVLINELEFSIKDNYQVIEEYLQSKIQEISTRGAIFDNMSLDERLKELSNLIENILKQNGKFISVDYENIFMKFITEDNIKVYRNNIHCFRHATEEALAERKQYNEEQKRFLIDYGIIVANHIYKNIKNNNI